MLAAPSALPEAAKISGVRFANPLQRFLCGGWAGPAGGLNMLPGYRAATGSGRVRLPEAPAPLAGLASRASLASLADPADALAASRSMPLRTDPLMSAS